MEPFLEKYTFLSSINFIEFIVNYSEKDMLTFSIEKLCKKIDFNLENMEETKSVDDHEDTWIICNEEDCVIRLILGMTFIYKNLYLQCLKVCTSIQSDEPIVNYLSNGLKKFAEMKSDDTNSEELAAILDVLSLNNEESTGLISLCEAYLYISSSDEYPTALSCLANALDFPVSEKFKCFSHYLCALLHSRILSKKSKNLSEELRMCRDHLKSMRNSSYQNDILHVHAIVVEVSAISDYLNYKRGDQAMRNEITNLLEALEKELLTVDVTAGLYARLGMIYHANGFDEYKALTYLRKSIEICPTSLAFHQIALIYEKNGDINEATDSMKQCLAFNKKPLGNAKFYAYLAFCHLKKGESKKCLALCDAALVDESLSFIVNEESNRFHRGKTLLNMKHALQNLDRQLEEKMVCLKLTEQNCFQLKNKIPFTSFVSDLRNRGKRFTGRDYGKVINSFRRAKGSSNFTFCYFDAHYIEKTLSQPSQWSDTDIFDVYLLLLSLFITDNNIPLPVRSVSSLLLEISRQFKRYKESFCMTTLHILMNFLEFSSECTDTVDLKKFSFRGRKFDIQVILDDNFSDQQWMMDFVNVLKFKYGMKLKVVRGELNLIDENFITVIFSPPYEGKHFIDKLQIKKALVIFDNTEYQSDENKLYMPSNQSIEEAFEKMMEFISNGTLIPSESYTEDHQASNDLRMLLADDLQLIEKWSNGTSKMFMENVINTYPPKHEIKTELTKTNKVKLLHFISLYHPDNYKHREFDEKWLLLTGEISKYLHRFL